MTTNRPIEFRAWNGYKMIYAQPEASPFRENPFDDHIAIGLNGKVYDVGDAGYGDGAWCYEHEEIKPEYLMQFTGMYDKHGTKIFESDIINHTSLDSSVVGKIIFINGAFIADRIIDEDGRPSTFHYNLDPKECTVIGNVHENPDLLEEKQ